MCFLDCSPCGQRVGKDTLCCSLLCGGFFFLAILVSHSSCVANREASSKSEHLQVCKVCKGTDVWSVVLKVTGAPI